MDNTLEEMAVLVLEDLLSACEEDTVANSMCEATPAR